MQKIANSDVIGTTHGRLTVISFIKEEGTVYLVCKCSCGKTKKVRSYHLLSGATKSCGCLQKEAVIKKNTIHEKSKDRVYKIWFGIKARCSKAAIKTRQPCYKEATISQEWESDYLRFLSWYENFRSYYPEEIHESLAVDKDFLIKGNTHYSEDTCVLIPQSLNNFLTLRENYRGDYPVGVSSDEYKKRISFKASISIKGRTIYLGRFSDPMLAHRSWQKAKIEQTKNLLKEQKHPKVVEGLKRILQKLEEDYKLNIETKTL